MLELQDLSVAYGHRVALQGISLTVGAGEIVTLVGGNGAGKSTTLKTISGLLRPRSGQIVFEGQRIDALAPHQILALGLAHVPEGRLLFKDMSVWEHLELGALRAPEQGAPFEQTLEWVLGLFPILRERRDQKAGTLSGGQQQMLAISRAIMAAPELILLDEPSLGLSPRLTKEIFEIVVRINRERGTSILLVEQNANMALNAADFGYVIENGRIVMQDSCAVLREKDDIKEFYLGMKETGVRGERRWKKKKTWR
jgi:branched-chain amino acid transport system ATP-binding protein